MTTPYLVLYAIAAIALVIWLFGLQFLLATGRRTNVETWAEEDETGAELGDAPVRGSAEVDGQPAQLAAKAAAHLAGRGMAMLGPVKILEQTDQRVAFEAAPHLGGRFVRHGVIEFQERGPGRTQIDYTIMVPKRTGLLAAAWIVQIAGLLALVIGFAVLHLWVAPHPNPAVHWQSVQMLQVVHLLWPPFLLAGLYRRVQTQVRTTMDTLVHNLPYVQ
jgi:hypothetical protein